MISALGGVLALVVLWLAWRGLRDPFLAVMALLVAHTTEPAQLLLPLSVLHIEKLAGGLAIISVILHHRRLRLAPPTRWMLILYGAALASIPASMWVANAITGATDFGKTILLAVLAAMVIETQAQLRTFLSVFALLIGYQAVTSAAYYYTGHYAVAEGFQRIIGLASNIAATDALALTMASGIPLVLAMAGRGERLAWRLLMVLAAAAALWVMLLTGSRITLLAFLVCAGISVLTSRRRVLLSSILVACAVVAMFMLPQQYITRYTEQTSTEFLSQENSYLDRLRIWHDGWDMFLKHPLTGIGVGDFNAVEGMFYWEHHWMDAHNLVIKILAEMGLVGLFAFTGFVVVLVRTQLALARMVRGRPELPGWLRSYPRAANLAIVTLLITGYGAHDGYRDIWYLMAAMSSSLWFMLRDESEKVPRGAESGGGEGPAVPVEPRLLTGVAPYGRLALRLRSPAAGTRLAPGAAGELPRVGGWRALP